MRLLLSALLALAPVTASAAQVRTIPAVAGAAPLQSAAAVRTSPVTGSALGLPLSRIAAAAPSLPSHAAPRLHGLPGVERPSPEPEASAQAAAVKSSPSRIVVSARNFEMPEKPLDPSELFDQMLEIKDRQARDLFLLVSHPLDFFEVLSAILGAHPGMKDEAAKELAKQVPAKLKAHFDEVLSRHRHVRSTQGGADVYEVSDGLGFWVDFMTTQDPLTRAGIQAFLAQSSRRIFSKDFAFDLVSALSDPGKAVTRLLDSERLSPADQSALEALARARDLDLSRHGRYILIGSGASFHLTRELLIEAARLQDPVLRARLDRVLRFLAAQGVLIDHDQHLAAAAFYDPLDDRLAYVMPSRADLNVLSHEGTHARFKRFEDALESWLKKKGYALPYEADGPRMALIGNGGYMSLLNELNSWRLGESFDGGKTDAEILGILRDSYGRQAGMQAAADFGRLWPGERVAGKSVPAMIRASALRLNKLSDADLAALGTKALGAADTTGQRDFLRVVRARFRGKPMPAAVEGVLRTVSQRGGEESIRETAEELLKPKEEEEAGSGASRRKAARAYSKEADEWLKGFASGDVKVIPWDLSWHGARLLKFARDHGSSSFEEAVAGLKALLGEDEVDDGSRVREAFEAVRGTPGATWDEKLSRHLADFNGRGFEALWAEFPKNPDYDLRQLLAEKHAAEFSPEDLARLAGWAAESGVKEELRSAAESLLSDVLDARGYGTIYPDSELASLRSMQKSFNESNGAPADSHMPENRRPSAGDKVLEALDAALSAVMFDGLPGIHRLKAIELAVSRTYPEELPRLAAKVAAVITDPASHRFDHWVARMFLVPADSILFHPHAAWGEAIARTVLLAKDPGATALEFVGEFIRTSIGLTLGGPQWGKAGDVRLDAATRREALEASQKLSKDAAGRRYWAAEALWTLLADPDRKAAKSALYALATHPVLVLALEERLAAELAKPDSSHRPAAVRLLAMSRPGFSPALDAALAGFAPTPEEVELLALRGF